MNPEIVMLLEHFKRFRGVLMQSLELLSEVRLYWKPFENFRTLGEQFYHIAQTEDYYIHGLFENVWQIDKTLPPAHPLNKEIIVNHLNAVRNQTYEYLRKANSDTLVRKVIIPNIPTQNTIRHWLWYILEHEIHHKAQIAVFLRQLDIVPPFFSFDFPNNFRPDIFRKPS